MEIFFFKLDSNYFQNILTLVWTIITKVVTVYLLAIWFATCKHWWYHAILIPMAMFIYQIAAIIILDFSYYQDEVSFYYTLPITLVIVVFLYGMRKLIAQNVTVINLQGDVDEELKKFERLDELKRLEKEKRKRMGSRDINDLL